MALSHSPKIVTDGLVLCLDAGDGKSYSGSGTTWTDRSGNGNNGTLTNGPTFDSNNRGSLSFDMLNDYIDCGNDTNVQFNSYSEMSMEAVFKTDFNVTDGHGNALICNRQSWNQGNVCFTMWHVQSNNSMMVQIGTNTSNQHVSVNTTSSINDGNIHHIQAVYDGSQIKVYFDGVLEATASQTGNILNRNAKLFIGVGTTNATSPSYAYAWNGNIYSVKLYNKALTAAEVLQNYNATKGRFS